jgi:hypothetical protein
MRLPSADESPARHLAGRGGGAFSLLVSFLHGGKRMTLYRAKPTRNLCSGPEIDFALLALRRETIEVTAGRFL